MYISDLYFYMYHVHLMKSQFDFNKNDETLKKLYGNLKFRGRGKKNPILDK